MRIMNFTINKVFLNLFSVIAFLPVLGFSQEQERKIDKLSWKNEPVKILGQKTKGKAFELGKKFSEDDDWLRGLTVTVKNVSDKPISRIEINLSFPRPKGSSEEIPTYTVSMIYGLDPSEVPIGETQKSVLPGESVDVKLLEVNLPFIETALKELSYPKKITHARIKMDSITFDDGTVWDGGVTLYPDPNNPKRKFNPNFPLPNISSLSSNLSKSSCNSPVSFFQDISFLNAKAASEMSSNKISFRNSALLQDPTQPCDTYFVQTLRPECGGSGSGCTRQQNIFDDTIEFLGRRNSRKQLSSVQCKKSDGTICSPTLISNFDKLPCNEQIASNCEDQQPPIGGCPGGGSYNYNTCRCDPPSPIIIDTLGNGFNLTSRSGGVLFDIDGDGLTQRMAWTSANSDDAFLVLDRNNNGTIDNGQELFGNFTSQPRNNDANGFLALAEFDRTEKGGNRDDEIDANDFVFSYLRLWRDTNHNGVSEASELFTLPALDVVKIELRYRESRRTDEYGNQFRYRAKVKDARGAQVGRWAWDVFFVAP